MRADLIAVVFLTFALSGCDAPPGSSEPDEQGGGVIAHGSEAWVFHDVTTPIGLTVIFPLGTGMYQVDIMEGSTPCAPDSHRCWRAPFVIDFNYPEQGADGYHIGVRYGEYRIGDARFIPGPMMPSQICGHEANVRWVQASSGELSTGYLVADDGVVLMIHQEGGRWPGMYMHAARMLCLPE